MEVERDISRRNVGFDVAVRVLAPWVMDQMARQRDGEKVLLLARPLENRSSDKKFYHVDLDPPEIAGAWLEYRKTLVVTQRINNAAPIKTRDGVPQVNFDVDYNKHGPAEREATLNSFELAKRGCNLIIWISPEDGGGVYNEGRLNIQRVGTEDGEIVINAKGIPLLWDRFASVELAEKLIGLGGMTMGAVDGVEGVRRQPIGFVLEDIDGWIDGCREMMPEFNDYWDFIEKQGDIENKSRMERDVRVALAMAGGNNYVFERAMAGMGNLINPIGGHGGSWLGAEGGVSSFRMTMVGGLINVKIEPRADGKIICPCGEVLKDGASKCPKCGLVITTG